MMKKVLIIFIFIAVIMIFATGCSMSRTAITAEQFAKKAEEAGYFIQDYIEYISADVVLDYLIAIRGTEEIDYQIEFVVVSTVEQAITDYNNNKADFVAQKTGTSSYADVTMGNYAYYVLTTGGRHYVISRIENTFIYINAEEQYKTEISDFLKTIGY
ncbi:MAG: hypothetical protein FWF15_01225 [Oscillospiraceae bacterium]|nr:hypothetical protein [Oscillospiraceae bacterium]